jgi:hypothetical protein
VNGGSGAGPVGGRLALIMDIPEEEIEDFPTDDQATRRRLEQRVRAFLEGAVKELP